MKGAHQYLADHNPWPVINLEIVKAGFTRFTVHCQNIGTGFREVIIVGDPGPTRQGFLSLELCDVLFARFRLIRQVLNGMVGGTERAFMRTDMIHKN